MRSFGPASLALLTACFVYSPAETRNTPAGKVIEVTLTQQGAATLEPQVGRFAHVIAGELMRDDAEGLQIRFGRVHRTDGQSLKGSGELLRVPHEHVVLVQERRVSTPRTWAASLVAIGGVVWMSRSR